MPIIQGIKRIDPLDLNKNVKIGVAFPLDETNMFNGTETIQEQTKANLISLLLTEPGERVNIPNYGVGLKTLLFENNIDIKSLKEKINQSIKRYITNVSLLDVQLGFTEDKHTLFISIVYKFLTDGTADNIQLNYTFLIILMILVKETQE